jgi:hypothetical protein
MELKMYTWTNYYAEIFVNGILRKFDVEYFGGIAVVEIDGGMYVCSRIPS